MQRVFCITQMGKVADRRLVFLRGICSGRGWKTDLGLRFVATISLFAWNLQWAWLENRSGPTLRSNSSTRPSYHGSRHAQNNVTNCQVLGRASNDGKMRFRAQLSSSARMLPSFLTNACVFL